MTEKSGIKTATERGIKLGDVGQRIVAENEHVRIWEVALEPGETIDFHIHYHPYVIISLGGGENEIETIFGDRIMTDEPLGTTVLINEMPAGAQADQSRQGSLSLPACRTQAHPLVAGVRNRRMTTR